MNFDKKALRKDNILNLLDFNLTEVTMKYSLDIFIIKFLLES